MNINVGQKSQASRSRQGLGNAREKRVAQAGESQQGALQLLASAFGLLLSGWVAWSLAESLREQVATHWQSLRLGLSMTSGQRLVALGDVVVFQANGSSSSVRPSQTIIGRSRGTKSGLWRFRLQTPMRWRRC